MKNFKRAAAILGVIVLLAVACLPMFFAFGTGKNSQGMFRASVGAVILVPVLAWVFLMVYRLLDKRNKEAEGAVKNVIFDVGEVLVKCDWQGYLDSLGISDDAYKAVVEKVFQSQIWNERDRGLYPEETYVQQFVDGCPEYEKEIRLVLERSGEIVSCREYAETWAKYLKEKGYHLYILSNYCEYMLEKTKPIMSFLKYMDGVVFSCEVQQIKPNQDIYQTLLGRYGLDPKECVFIDDKAENCETARSLGIQAVQFYSFKQAAADLEKLGVK